MSKTPSMGIYGSTTDRDAGTRLRKEQGHNRVSASIKRSFDMSVRPRDREPGPVRQVFHREQQSAGGGRG